MSETQGQEAQSPTTDGADTKATDTDATGTDGNAGETTVNTGGGDAVVNEAPDGGGVDNNSGDNSSE